MTKEEETRRVGQAFLWLLTGAVVLLVMAGCATSSGRTTIHEDSLICVGFCMETEFDSQTEIVKK